MICQNCSNVIPDGSTFCGFCGQAVVAPSVPSEPAPVIPEPPVAAPVSSEPAPAVIIPDPPAAPVAAPAVEATAVPEPVPAPVTIPEPAPESAPAPDTTTFFRDEKQERRLGAWGYVWTDIVLCLPIINIIMFFVWCFSSGTNKARQSYVRSRFIWFVISIILSVIFAIVMLSTNPKFFDSFNQGYAQAWQNLNP